MNVLCVIAKILAAFAYGVGAVEVFNLVVLILFTPSKLVVVIAYPFVYLILCRFLSAAVCTPRPLSAIKSVVRAPLLD